MGLSRARPDYDANIIRVITLRRHRNIDVRRPARAAHHPRWLASGPSSIAETATASYSTEKPMVRGGGGGGQIADCCGAG